MDKPELKTPPPPTFAYLDLDAVLFAAASAGEQVVYTAVAPDGTKVAQFNSAEAHKKWLTESEMFGMDTQFGYDGDLSELTREVHYEVLDFEECTKAFDKIVKRWVKQSGCEEYVGYVSKATGLKNFRYEVATVAPYKGNRKEVRKPHWLEALRKHVTQLPYVKVPRGPYEVDDVVVAYAQKKRYRGCVVGVDKDARGAQDTHILIPEEMKEPQFSSKKIVGRLYPQGKKAAGYGTLFWLYQALHGDSVDNIPGCAGVGPKTALKVLEPFDGVDAKYLKDAIKACARVYADKYGLEPGYKYKHCTTGEKLTVSGKEIFTEMSRLVYMKKSRSDECFWLPIIEEVWEELKCE